MAELNLPNIREGGNIRFRIGLEDGGVAVDWSGLEDIRVFLYADAQKQVSGECTIEVDAEDNTVLACLYSGDDVQFRGINSVLVRAKYMGDIKVYDKPAINIVARTSEATGVVEIDDPVVPVQISVEDVSTSLLNNAIDAAINAAAEAEKAAHLVPLQVLEDCVEATGKALEAASKAPYIDETTGNWFVWDAEAGEYVDSGKTARGATGNGIASWSVVESAEDAGNNVVTVTFTDGTSESFNVKNGHTGNGIASIVQTVESPDDAGTNVITITMTNGTVVTFNVKNGSKGTPGVAQAAYKSVSSLPTASAQTMDKIYLTPSGTSGVYNMSYTEFDGSAYSWQDLGTTAIQLSDYATKAELNQLEAEVADNTDNIEALQAEIDGINPIVIQGNVTNAPDEEDITSENNLLKFKDRTQAINGQKGYVILRKNKTFAEQVVDENTIYEIRYAFDLNNDTVSIPENCTLLFMGGTLSNGCIIGNNTTIRAKDEKIFTDVALFQCCFSGKSGNYTEVVTPLPWIDIATRKVECNITGKNWKIRTSGAVRYSNADGLGTFVQFDGTNNYLESDRELLLQENPGSFRKVNNGTTILAVISSSLNETKVLTVKKETDNVSLVIPSYSRWAFFSSNDAGDNPNDTYLAPGTVVDLSQNTVYCTYLNRVMYDISHSTFANSASLSWFVGDEYADVYSDISSVLDMSKEVQMALDSPMDLYSNIRGIIKLSNTVYLETKKRINLGGKYWVAGKEEWASNSKQSNKFNFICTVFAGFISGYMLVIRNCVDITGGLFTTNFNDGATEAILVIDGDYYSSECNIETSLIGTKKPDGSFNCNKGIFFDYTGKFGGYNYFSRFKCDVSFCKYAWYCDYVNYVNDCHINTADIDLVVWGYYEAIHNKSCSSCHIRAVLQANACVPLAEVDNYRNFIVTAARCVVDVTPWDWSTAKTTAAFQKPYLAPIIAGTGTIISGVSAGNNEELQPSVNNKYYGGPNPLIEAGDGYGTSFRHILIENVFAGLEGDSTTMKSSAFYYRKFKIKEGESIDVSAYNGRCIDSSAFDSEVVSTGFISSSAIFSTNSSLPTSGTYNIGEFAEVYFETNPNQYLDFGIAWVGFALTYKGMAGKNPWKYAKVIVGNESTFPLRTVDIRIEAAISEMSYFRGLFSTQNINITKLLIRCYCDAENGYGVSANGVSANIPKIVAWSAHSYANYISRKTQERRVVQTSTRPTKNLLGGMMTFNSTLKAPEWWDGSGWRNSNGFPAVSPKGTTANRPSLSAADAGFIYYDSSLGKLIVWSGSAWVNADGTALS